MLGCKMKQLYIIPPSPYLTNQKAVISLGILYVAAYQENLGNNCRVIDLSGDANYINNIVLDIQKDSPDYIGITANSGQIKYAIEISQVIKNYFPNIKIIIGGPHITNIYFSHKKHILRAWTGSRAHAFHRSFTPAA